MLARLVNRPNSTTAGEYIDRILRARVYDVAMESPLERASRLSRRVGNEILLKREDLQPTFSFKLRGAYNKIASLSNHAAARGVICASAGNHAQGVALAASRRQIPAVIVMPVTTPRIKVQAVADLGGEVVLHGDDYDSAYERALVIARERQMVFVHPFDDPDVIAGQGTIGMEISRQTGGNIDAVFVPVGGGGLLVQADAQHHGGAEHHGHGVGLVLPCNVGGGAVDRLVEAEGAVCGTSRAERGRWEHAE